MSAVEHAATPGGDSAAALRHVRAVVTRSGTSFGLGMRILPKARRDAMYAIYAFCREVDDVADDPGEPADKMTRLAAWRAEVDRLYAGRPTRPTTVALREPVSRYGLPRAEFLAIIEGMEMDAEERMRAPDIATLRGYCRRVAGAVGMLSVPVFGAVGPAARDFAVDLGEALQLTNILRDIPEDAQRGRLYLPRELLERHGIAAAAAVPEILAAPAMGDVFTDLAGMARDRFRQADAVLARCDRQALRPALLMMGIYDRLLQRLTEHGWRSGALPPPLTKAQKLWAAVRYGLWRRPWRPST